MDEQNSEKTFEGSIIAADRRSRPGNMLFKANDVVS